MDIFNRKRRPWSVVSFLSSIHYDIWNLNEYGKNYFDVGVYFSESDRRLSTKIAKSKFIRSWYFYRPYDSYELISLYHFFEIRFWILMILTKYWYRPSYFSFELLRNRQTIFRHRFWSRVYHIILKMIVWFDFFHWFVKYRVVSHRFCFRQWNLIHTYDHDGEIVFDRSSLFLNFFFHPDYLYSFRRSDIT